MQAVSFIMISKDLKAGKKKRVLFLTPWYPNRFDSMFGLFVQRHAQAIAPDYQVSVIYLHGLEDDSEAAGLDIEIQNGVEEIRVYYHKKSRLPGSMKRALTGSFYVRAFRDAWDYYKNQHGLPDLIHVHVLTRSGVMAWLLKKRFDIPYVITEHWSRYLPAHLNYKGWLRKKLTKKVVSEADAFSAISKKLLHAMNSHGLENKHSMIINNVVDTSHFKPVDSSGNGKKEFIHISCFEDKSKNISGLLEMIRQLSEKRSDFHLSMVGDGIDFYRMKEKAAVLNIPPENINFLGLLEGEELVKQLQEADLLLISSHYENMPVVINEAFSCGVPVISTNVGGIAEHVDEQKGLIVPPGNQQAYITALDQFLDGKYSFNSDTIRQSAVENYSKQAIRRQFRNLYSFTGRI